MKQQTEKFDAVRKNIDIVIHCEKDNFGVRRIAEISLVNKTSHSESLNTHTLLAWKDDQYQVSIVDFDMHEKFIPLKEMVIQMHKEISMSSIKLVIPPPH